MTKLGLELPLNTTSLGGTSISFLRNLYKRQEELNLDIFLFPIGQVDFSAQTPDVEFEKWVQAKIARAQESWDKKTPLFKLWHLNGSLQSYSVNQTLLTFFELDKLTKFETNIAKNSRLALSSKYSQDVFKTYGIESSYLPLFFDSYNFTRQDKKFHTDDRIVFNICGKFEKRKHHAKAVQAWIKKYGNDRRYVLQCALYNPFLLQQTPQGIVDHNQRIFNELVGGNKPFNVVFYPFMKENTVYNQFLNSANIILGLSGGESWGLPEFHSIAMGKHAVMLNAHSYKEFANTNNSVIINPSGKEEVYDNVFFAKGQPFNQGDIFSWNEDDFINGCEVAIKKAQASPVNEAGLSLQQEFSIDKFTNEVLKITLTNG